MPTGDEIMECSQSVSPADMPNEGFAGLGVSLLFTPGERPDLQQMTRFLADCQKRGLEVSFSHLPHPGEGWVELLTSGLTFDLVGLSPADSAPLPAMVHCYGSEGSKPLSRIYEAVSILPANHIAAGAGMLPVIRALAGLAANVALEFPVTAVSWHSAQTFMPPQYFIRVVMNWLSGGTFPALGLAALVHSSAGSIISTGLMPIVGQEFQLESGRTEDAEEMLDMALRVADHLVRHGPLSHSGQIEYANGTIELEPSKLGQLVLAWKVD